MRRYRNIVVKLEKIKNKKNFEVKREKELVIQKVRIVRLIRGFLFIIIKIEREWNNSINVLTENFCDLEFCVQKNYNLRVRVR